MPTDFDIFSPRLNRKPWLKICFGTATPADILRLPLGRLSKGAAADLVLFDLDRPGRIDVDAFRSKSKNSPFENMPVQGQVRRTIVEGRTLYEAD